MGARRWMPPILFRLVVALVLSAEILAAMPVEASPTSARPTPTVAPTRVRSAAPRTPTSAPSRLAPTPTRTPTRVTGGRIARVGPLGALFSAPGSPTTGVAWVWGMNQRGELGMPTGTGGASCADEACRLVPLLNQAHAGLTRVSGGFLFSLALTAAGQVWAWGAGGMGQLGSNAAGDSQTRVQVVDSSRSGVFSGVTSGAAGGYRALALKSDGHVWAWGADGSGQLGDGSTTQSTTPVAVSGLSNVVAIAAGGSHARALDTSGTLWAWGDNAGGDLGNGTGTLSTVPLQVSSSLAGGSSVAAGWDHTLALLPGGAVWPPPPGSALNRPEINTVNNGDPVNSATGNDTDTRVDLALAGRGPSPAFARSDNRDDTRVTPPGPGWTFNADVRLNDPGDGTDDLILVGPQGRSDRYHYLGGGAFRGPPGVATTLTWNSDGTYTATRPDQATGPSATGGQLSRTVDSAGNVQVYHTDGLGSVRAITDANEKVIGTYQMMPATAGIVSNPGNQASRSLCTGWFGRRCPIGARTRGQSLIV